MKPPAALREADFRSLWLAGLVSDAGDWMLFIALPIVVYGLTGSALGTSVAFLAELAPGIVLAPVAGRLADRVDRRRLMLAVTVLQAASLLPLWFVHGRSGLALVYLVIVVQAALSALFDPAKNALLPSLVPRGELVSANSLVGLNQNIGRLVGGPLGGALLAAGDLRTVVLADGASFLLAAVLLARLGRPRADRAPEPRILPAAGPRRQAEGFLAALRGREIRAGLAVAFVAQMAQGIFVVLFVVFVARRLHGGPAEIGLLRGVQAVGAIGGALALTVVARGRSPAALTAGAAIAFGLIDLVLWNAPALTTTAAFYVVLFIVVGAPGVMMVTGLVSSLQLAGADAERGRIFSALGLAGNAGQAVGMIAAGTLTGPLGLMTILNTQACLYLGAGGVAARLLVRRSETAVIRAGDAPARAGLPT